MAGALGFFAAFFDMILELIGRQGTGVLGITFVVYLFWLRKRITVNLGPKHELPLPNDSGSQLDSFKTGKIP